MASLRNKPLKPDGAAGRAVAWLRQLQLESGLTAPRICVAFSGGLDSTVLLHQLAQAREVLPFSLSAIHVHHGLSKNATAWARHCRQVCAGLDVPLRVRRVEVNRAPRTSLEAEARRARYAAFAAANADVIGMAHHADDQAETVLLQLLRGAGPKGLSGMPHLKPLPTNGLGHISLWRPLLECTRAELAVYAQRHNLPAIDDESNADERFRRNYLRHRVMPLLKAGFPAATATLARAARHQAEAAELLDVQADADLAQAKTDAGLHAETLKQLGDARCKNALRRWLERAGLRQPSEARLNALIKALRDSSNDTRLAWVHELRTVRREKDLLRLA